MFPDELQQQIRFNIEQLSARNGHADFEKICLFFAQNRIHKNVLPATGPVQAGGDQGRDFETFPSYLHDLSTANSLLAANNVSGSIAFACSLEKSPETKKGKIYRDVKSIMSSGNAVERIYFFSGDDIAVGKRHKCENEIRAEFKVELNIIDVQALSLSLTEDSLSWIAIQYLRMPSEYFNVKTPKVGKKKYPIVHDYIERTITPYQGKYEIYQQAHWWLKDNKKKETLTNLFELTRSDKAIRIVLLSIAGFGKTLEINHLAGYFSDEKKWYSPIKYSLKNYLGQEIITLLRSINENWQQLREETVFLLFDGLDEISENKYNDFIKQLNAFVEAYPKINICISSRFNAYNLKLAPLVSFEVYLLNSLTRDDIDFYLQDKLGDKKKGFIHITEERGLDEFNQNPYYLTRMVRLYKTSPNKFPLNKSDLFSQILFEQLDKDETRYDIPELKEKLLPVAEKIAFCMTLSGKSTLTDLEIKTVVPDRNERGLLKKFSIILSDESNLGSWSFEHKNLQEFLCASCFKSQTFFELNKIISFSFDSQKLLPHFLNAISFLFEIVDRNEMLFSDLFQWLQKNEPELLIRFEKEQLLKQTKFDIFKTLFEHYENIKVSLRITSNFSLEELANFVGVDDRVIDFLALKLKSELFVALDYDSIRILKNCKNAYLYKDKIVDIVFTCLSDRKKNCGIHAACINLLNKLGYSDKAQLRKIIASGISLNDFEIRQEIICLLKESNYFEEFAEFIVNSIPIFEASQTAVTYGGSNRMLSELISKLSTPSAIKKIFQYSVEEPNCFSPHHHAKEFQFSLEEFGALIANAKWAFNVDKSLLRIIYRLFRSLNIYYSDKDNFNVFKDFFEYSCGSITMFRKLFSYDKGSFKFLQFVSIEGCDYLLLEYTNGNITESEIKGYRNWLLNQTTCGLYFQDKLMEISAEKFSIDDKQIDYNLLRAQQEEKNQQMILDRNLFFEEIDEIFNVISKGQISWNDLWEYENKKLFPYQDSIALQAIKDFCVHDEDKIITRAEFLASNNTDEDWTYFVLGFIEKSLVHNKVKKLSNELEAFVQKWCREKIQSLDFSSCVKDTEGSFTHIGMFEHVKRIFLLIDLDLSDKDLMKMLQSDYQSFLRDDEKEETISTRVVKSVKDRALLKQVVLNNISNGNLALMVLCSHFKLCYILGYPECLGLLFGIIVSNSRLTGDEKIKLTTYYVSLGGEFSHFSKFVSIPDPNLNDRIYSSWDWHLLENLREIEWEKVTDILLEIIGSNNHCTQNKTKACELLILLSNIEGLKFWIKKIKETNEVLFEHQWEQLNNYVLKMPLNESIDITLDMFEFIYQNNLGVNPYRPYSVREIIHNLLFQFSLKGRDEYLTIKSKFEVLAKRYENEDMGYDIRVSSERLTQFFFEKQMSTINITEANQIYNDMFGSDRS